MAQDLRPENLIGHQLLDGEGHSVGKINQVYLDDRTNEPSWVSVHTGLFGRKETLVPLQGAQPTQEDLQVPYDKATVKDAPHLDSGTHISPETEARVRDYYASRIMVPHQRSGRHERGYSEIPVVDRETDDSMTPGTGYSEADAGSAPGDKNAETGPPVAAQPGSATGAHEDTAAQDVVTESGTPGIKSPEDTDTGSSANGRHPSASANGHAPSNGSAPRAQSRPAQARPNAGVRVQESVPLQEAAPLREPAQVEEYVRVREAMPVRESVPARESESAPAERSAGAPEQNGAGAAPATESVAAPAAGMPAEDVVITRSEEQVDIGIERIEVGRARLNKYVDSEDFEETVTLRREELEIERRPVEEGEDLEPHIGEDEQIFTLYEERAVVSKQQVPVERVVVRKRTVDRQEQVRGTRLCERVELEDEEGRPPSQE